MRSLVEGTSWSEERECALITERFRLSASNIAVSDPRTSPSAPGTADSHGADPIYSQTEDGTL